MFDERRITQLYCCFTRTCISLRDISLRDIVALEKPHFSLKLQGVLCPELSQGTCCVTTAAVTEILRVQSAAHAKQVLEGHAMYEGGSNVLRLSYSVHRDLNVKNSGDKSRDFSMPLGVPSSGYHQHAQQHHHQQQQYAPNPYDGGGGGGGHAPPPHHGSGQFGDEAPVTGAINQPTVSTHYFSSEQHEFDHSRLLQ